MEPTAVVHVADAATGAADQLLQLLLRPENLYLMVAVYGLIATIRKVLPPKINKNHLVIRLMPLYPLVLCSIGVWIPLQQPADMSIGSKVLVGIILGWACGHMNKVWTQTIRAQDSRLSPGSPEPPSPTP